MQREVEVSNSDDLAGSARLELVEGVTLLDPESALFEAMLSGWARQQRARFLQESQTIAPRIALVRRFAAFSGQYPWDWQPSEAEAFISHLRSTADRPVAVSTARGYEVVLRLFCEFVTDPRYSWSRECLSRFGRAPQQIFHEWNSIAHVSEYEGDPRRRPLTYDEVQLLFDAADGRVENIRCRRRKGALAAMRDAALLKTIYAYGLRRQEACGLDLVDLRHNPKAVAFGRFGAVFIRYGKASRGGPPKRRTVLTVPEMDWIVPALEQWVDEVRPLFAPGRHPALWMTERRGRLSRHCANEAFAYARAASGLPAELDLHCLRHSYITHLVEFGYPERFVQDQVGHQHASTTALYTGVSDEFRTRLLMRAMEAHGDELGMTPQ
ncbi:tyrosine-type recombinase/integrase [Streptomyces sp. NPDC001980]|uniref:tyrosine-type recombinase/integrase n=1 Tax=Streptomyces sp. NPDC001980 TaxID=3157126 RepID=UPI003321FFA2